MTMTLLELLNSKEEFEADLFGNVLDMAPPTLCWDMDIRLSEKAKERWEPILSLPITVQGESLYDNDGICVETETESQDELLDEFLWFAAGWCDSELYDELFITA